MGFSTPDNLPGLTPKSDEHFIRLLQRGLEDELPVYFAAVPLAVCIPFDPDYRPDLHPVGKQSIEQAAAAGKQGKFENMFTYQRGYWFVISDDYIPYFAALTGLPDYVPCFILGHPDHALVRDLQGPIDPISLRQLLGFTTKEGQA